MGEDKLQSHKRVLKVRVVVCLWGKVDGLIKRKLAAESEITVSTAEELTVSTAEEFLASVLKGD